MSCKVLVATALLVTACICVAVASQGVPPQAYPATVLSGSEGCPSDEKIETVRTELYKEVCIYHISDFLIHLFLAFSVVHSSSPIHQPQLFSTFQTIS